MRQRGVMYRTAALNAVVLALGLVVAVTRASAPPDVAFGPGEGDATAVAAQPQPADRPPLLEPPDDLEPVDPGARLVALPHHELDYLPPVVRQGVLAGDAGLDGGCVWVEMDGVASALRWPPGYQVAFEPAPGGAQRIALVDPDGLVRARAGDLVYFTGAGSGGPERLERCHVGADHVWYVDQVSTVAPTVD